MKIATSSPSWQNLLLSLAGPMAVAGLFVACSAADDNRLADGSVQGDPAKPSEETGLGGFDPGKSLEECNGYDDNSDGRVDEGCPCEAGQVQQCYTGPPVTDGIGICRPGSQECWESPSDSEFDLLTWGPCVGSILPEAEICESGVDEDCNGVDDPCPGGSGGAGSGAGGAGAGGSAPGGGGPGGSGGGATGGSGTGGSDPGVVEVDILFFGDCVWATCPTGHPYPVGCEVFFTPGDDRGCVANKLGESPVYFQAGDECDEGFVTGKLLCSDTFPTEPLSAANCPINKPIPIYGETPDDCPETH